MSNPASIDITNMPELIRIVEKVRGAKVPLSLKKNKKTVAVVMSVNEEKDRDTFLGLMDEAADNVNVSEEETMQLTNEAIAAVRKKLKK